MSEVNLYNLSVEELKEQARILGIVIRGNPSADTLRDRIRAAVNIEPAEGSEPRAEEAPDRRKDWKTVVISEDERDQQPVFVGVNGKSYWIRRGEPVRVPRKWSMFFTTQNRLYGTAGMESQRWFQPIHFA